MLEGRPAAVLLPGPSADRALDVFWRKGYDGTSLSDLTAAMGINRPSLYAAYGNKEALFRRAMARYGQRAAELFRAAGERPTARAFIEFVLTESAVRFTDPAHPPGCFMVQGAGGSCGQSEAMRREMAVCRTGPTELFRNRFDHAVAVGELPAGTATAALARYFTAVMQGMALQAAGGATFDALKAVLETAMRAWPGAD